MGKVKFTKKTFNPFFLAAFKGSGNADQMSVGLLGMYTQQTHRLQSKKNFAKTIKEGQFYRFTFSRQGKVYSMYVDGKLHLQISSAKYTVPSGASWVKNKIRSMAAFRRVSGSSATCASFECGTKDLQTAPDPTPFSRRHPRLLENRLSSTSPSLTAIKSRTALKDHLILATRTKERVPAVTHVAQLGKMQSVAVQLDMHCIQTRKLALRTASS